MISKWNHLIVLRIYNFCSFQVVSVKFPDVLI